MQESTNASLRERMVVQQLVGHGVTDQRVLEAMRRVPRHRFVDANQAAFAYENRPLPIGANQTISQPLMVALMLQSAELTGTENVLEVGAGSGYQAALLSELAARVTSIERIEALANRARAALKSLGYETIEIVHGDGTLGYPPNALYDRILVAAGAPRVPEPLLSQLAPNGRLILPVGDRRNQTLIIMSKDTEGKVSRREEGWCSFVPLVGKAAWPESVSARKPPE
jgi:protein-L-isoaspartate(D-aspartate) O-methyltransferase